jgi:competence protein ComEC
MARTIFIGDALFCAAIGFLAGILAASLGWDLRAAIGWAFAAALVIFILAKFTTFTAVATVRKGTVSAAPIFTIVALCLFSFLFGAFYYRFYLNRQAASMRLPPQKSTSFSAIVVDEPTTSAKSILLKTELEKPYAGAITIFASLNSHYHYGDELKISGAISPAKDTWSSPAVFPKSIKLVAQHKAFRVREWLINLKLAIIDRYNEVLSPDQAMLLGGITFGAKQNFKQDLKDAMAASGTTHLVAISGYNITIVIVAAEGLFAGWLSRRAKFLITVALIVLFVLMTGLQSSAIRAAIMGFLALMAKESGRVFSMRNAIVLTAAVMAGITPTILVHDVGFELSFMSLLGIVCLCDPLKKVFRLEDSGVLDWKDSAVTTLSAQLGTMPVLIAVFNQFSATAIAPNVLILGTVPLTMLLGFILAVFGFISASLVFLVAKLAALLLAYQLGVIRLFATLAIPLPFTFNSASVFIIYYSALAWFALSHQKSKEKTHDQ